MCNYSVKNRVTLGCILIVKKWFHVWLDKYWVASIKPHNLSLISMGMKQKNTSKTFSNPTILSIFSQKFQLDNLRGWAKVVLVLHKFAWADPWVATSMPFAPVYPMNPKTNPWSFGEKILRIGGFEKLIFFELVI